MLKKRNLIFLSLLILGVFLITSCLPKPPVTEGILKGQVIVPEGTVQVKDLTGQALPDATVNIIDPATGNIIATTITDADGYYQVFVPAGGPYILEAIKDGVRLQQVTPQVEVGIEYDLGTADCSTTSVALIAQAMLDAEDYPDNLADINLSDIAADPDFNDVMSDVCSIIEAGGDPAESVVVQQAVEDFLHPPTPSPTPTPTPTYTVTFNSQGGSAVDPQTVEHGGLVIGPTAPTRTGYAFGGWYKESGCTNTWNFATDTVTSDVTIYAKWTINSYTLTMSNTGTGTGTTTPTEGTHTYDYGTSVTISASADGTSTFAGWSGDASGTSNVTLTMTENKSVTATFTLKTYTITATAGSNGTIDPSGATTVNHGSNQSFTITAATNYHIADVLVDGSSVGAVSSYTFTTVIVDHTIAATFTINSYNITFDKNDAGATGTMTPQTIDSGSSANLTACAFTKTGWAFAGWATTPTGAFVYADGASYTMGTSNVTLYAKWTPPDTYSLRDIGPAGGWIFYDKGSYSGDPSWRYLEAAPSDQGTGTEWGCNGTEISGADGQVVGTGKQNTDDILAGCATSGIAARLCVAYSTIVSEVTYDDWFLPSKDELYLMYVNLKVAGVGGFADNYYWSSSEFDADAAWCRYFYSGFQDYYFKLNPYLVRAVRAF